MQESVSRSGHASVGPSRPRLRLALPGIAAALIVILLAAPAVWANVGLTRFEAEAEGNTIVVTWETQTELNTSGFRLYRATSYAPANWGAPIHEPPAKGGLTPATYNYTDAAVQSGVLYYYMLEALASDGSTTRYGPVSAGIGLRRLYLPLVRKSAMLTAGASR
jgi:hypothetical protein